MDILKKRGLEWRGRRFVRNLFPYQKVRVKVGDITTEGNKIKRGVMQGCCLSPALFNIYLENIIKDSFNKEREISLGGRIVECIRFADDMAILASSEEEINRMLEDLREKLE